MSSPIKSEYQELIKKYLAGSISSDEMEVLDRYYSLFRNEPGVIADMDKQDITILENRLQEGILNRVKQADKPVLPIYKRTWFRVAAAVVICFSVVLMVIKKSNTPQYTANTVSSHNIITAEENHFLTLPDSSRIVLRKGSKLTVAGNFKTGATREVTLSGEAYFDIKHNNKRPFIIHTGNIHTTVLGTAFNIQAYSGQKTIIVTVTRGRVKVEQGKKLLAILTPNKQLTASTDQKQATDIQKKVVAVRTLDWARTDMSFDAMPFSQLAAHLDKRYDVQITFKNPALAGCPITGTFTGTESLTEVLTILSQTRGTSYAINGKEVVIDGKGCN
jgi:ferric-dicitrate binding protein FerR (iron transport regulator)